MMISVPSYVYTYIKIGSLKQLIIDDNTLKKLKDFDEIEDFINFIEPFYPDLNIKEDTIEEIEKALYHFFFKLIGELISISPINMRRFLKDYLVKYEIMNIKQIILGFIIGMNHEEILKNVNFLIEEYLENTDLIKKIIEVKTLDEIQLYMKPTKYNKVIREGFLYFKNYKEIFVLEAFLDQLYYENLSKRERILNKKEKAMISLFNSLNTEIYNINIIYRGIINKIDKTLLAQFIINNYFFLKADDIENLLNQETLNDFFLKINECLESIHELKYKFDKLELKHPLWDLERMYKNYYFTRSKLEINDIESLTIFRILELIIKKEKEIKLEILPKVVAIINKKFNSIKLTN
ncbi:MAG: V-type ATPase subunit [Promethearchaeota archaeon]